MTATKTILTRYGKKGSDSALNSEVVAFRCSDCKNIIPCFTAEQRLTDDKIWLETMDLKRGEKVFCTVCGKGHIIGKIVKNETKEPNRMV